MAKVSLKYENLPQVTQTLTSIEKKKYKLTNVLGKGGYGLVFKCTDENNKFCFFIDIILLILYLVIML